MASFAAEKFQGYPKVEIKNISFEDWESQIGHFDMVISGSAFHWIKPEIAYPKVAQVLKENGHIAIFMHHRPTPYDEFFMDMQEIQKRLLPEWEDYTKFTRYFRMKHT
jgi:SAM-dependent methyltransferase